MIQRKRRRIKRIFAGLLCVLVAGCVFACWRGWYTPQVSHIPLAAIVVLAVYNLSLLLAQRR